MKRLSLPSNNLNVNNDDLLKVKDEYFDTMSTKSMDSQQTVNSKISFMSSQSSNRSSFMYNNNNVGSKLMTNEDQQKIKEMKRENAKIHLNIEQLKLEKKYYVDIIKSIGDVIIKHEQLTENSHCSQTIQDIRRILNAEMCEQ